MRGQGTTFQSDGEKEGATRSLSGKLGFSFKGNKWAGTLCWGGLIGL